jgi:hypothetical protein
MSAGVLLRPVTGEGVLARFGSLIMLTSVPPGSEELVSALISAHQEVAQRGGDGTALADRLGAVLATSPATVDLVAFGPSGPSLAIAVYGHAFADVSTVYGEQRLALRQSRDGVRSVLPGQLISVRAGLGDAAQPEPQRFADLDLGVVQAGGLVFTMVGAPDVVVHTDAPPSEMPDVEAIPSLAALEAEREHAAPLLMAAPDAPAEQALLGPAAPVVAEPEVDRSQPFHAVSLLDPLPDVEPDVREPLPIAEPLAPVAPDVAPAPHPPADDRVQVMGVYCKNGHFDDPAARYCAICGISMAQQTLIPRLGPRPPLGVLVMDDGSIVSLDRDYVIGRDPQRDPDVANGVARPIRVDDQQGQLSRLHARIHLEGWQVEVIDLGSANGTGIWRPGDTAWTRVPPQTRIPIRPGTQVGFGRNQLRFESHTNT